ncbi:hypothetical protein [Pseudomonas aeruginosa]|uniref:hypothetical protein n=1 Tax=Pseudomonas aeruginosa TaxID=287 RepID=UPI003BF56277
MPADNALPHQGLLPGSYKATFKVGGVERTVLDSGNGSLSGTGGSGQINYADGKVSMELSATPDAGSGIVHTYQQGANGGWPAWGRRPSPGAPRSPWR